MKDNFEKILFVSLVVLIGTFFYLAAAKKPSQAPTNKNSYPTPPSATPTIQIETIDYLDTQYGFSFSLPISWKGYSIVTDKWVGTPIGNQKGAQISGPKVIIRHPLWTAANPRQDIPILVFTLAQWDLVQQEKISLGAAPIGPSELGRNAKYVFALPARYNFAFPIGFEEVEKIIESKALKGF